MARDGVVEFLDHYAGLNGGRQILGVHFQNAIHSLERQYDSALQRDGASTEVGACPARVDGDAASARQIDDTPYFFRVGRHYHDAGTPPRHVGRGVEAISD
jgi:hypothetical protein